MRNGARRRVPPVHQRAEEETEHAYRFDAIIATEGLPGKPAPDAFLAASQAFGVSPKECVVFDAVIGVRAGVAAGMRVVGITTTVDAATLLSAGAAITAAHFDEVPWPP